MAKKDLVSEEILEELIKKLESIINNYCHNLEYFTEDEVNDFFNADSQEITYYSSLIKDDVVSKNFLHSSKQIADDIAQSILEANEYTDSLLKNISSIQLEWCETNLPTTGENNKIYILPVTSGSTTTVNTLNIWNNTSNDWVSIGNLEIDITQFYNKSEIDTKMDLKANKTEVVANDKIVQTLDSATNSSDTVLSTSGLQIEMDKKANSSDLTSHTGNTDIHITTSERTKWNEVDNKVDKTNIATSIDSTSTNNEVVGAKAFYDFNIDNMLNVQANMGFNIDTYQQPFIAHVNNNSRVLGTFPTEVTWGAIIQLPAQGYRAQMLITEQGMYYRIMNSWTWKPWYKVNATQVTDETTYPKQTP